MMILWKTVFRHFAAIAGEQGLQALLTALETDDPRLMQGATVQPPPLAAFADWPVESACPIALCGWLGDGLATVAETEEFFARACFAIDERLGEPGGCRHFLHFADETPREEMRAALIEECKIALGLTPDTQTAIA